MGIDKRCVASGKALLVKSAAIEIQRVKILYIYGNLCKTKQMHARKTVCGDEFAIPYIS